MKFKLYTLALALLLLNIRCQKENVMETNNAQVPVQFTSGIGLDVKPQTKVGVSFDENSEIGVFMMRANIPDVNCTNKLYTKKNGSNKFTSSSILYYPLDGSSVDFVAYYPYNNAQNSLTYSVSSPNPEDLLYAKVTGMNKYSIYTVDLEFSHLLSKIEFIVKAGDGITQEQLSDLKISINQAPTSAIVNLGDGNLSYESTDIGKVSFFNTAGGFIIPFTTTPNTYFIFKIDTNSYKWDISSKTFEQGYIYKYTATISRTKIRIETTEGVQWDYNQVPIKGEDGEITIPTP